MVADRSSALAGALRRVGKKMDFVESVEGSLQITERKENRVYGVLRTHDASISVGFESSKVSLPVDSGPMRITGKIWLDEFTGRCTIFVTRYSIIDDEA